MLECVPYSKDCSEIERGRTAHVLNISINFVLKNRLRAFLCYCGSFVNAGGSRLFIIVVVFARADLLIDSTILHAFAVDF